MKRNSAQQGVSLIEALVAMAVMGFGMLGVLGLQSSLRGNADVSKQRSEAVRIAQETIETARAFSVLGAAPGSAAYDSVATTAATDITRANSNSTFSLQTTVISLPTIGNEDAVAAHKRLVVTVGWRDRNDVIQTMQLATMVSAVAPETAAALAAPGDAAPVQRPAGRHPVVPRQAVNLGNGSSSFAPPGAADGISWTFNNTSGYITQLCTSLTTCTEFPGRLVSGYVNFVIGATAPTAADAETPTSPPPVGSGSDPWRVRVATTEPAVGTVTCFQQRPPASNYVAYFCALPVTSVAPFYWSGRVELSLPAGLDLATDIADNNAARFRVCRYTPAAARVTPHLVVPAMRNEDHPLDYFRVASSLGGQNYLVINAGNGVGSAFECPADDAGTSDLNGSTWHHQPSL